MVKSFQLSSTPSIIFGVGKRRDLPQLIKKTGSKVLVITGGGSFGKLVNGSELLTNIETAVDNCYYARIIGEPTPETIDQISSKFSENPPDVVVSVGGGSVIDAGKAISAMIGKNESIIEYLEGVGTKQPNGTKVPFIAVPTTAGTGSETTKNAVISRIGEQGFKKSLRHDNYVPNIALVDPELTLSCSKEITASSGLDALTQLLEAYVSPKSSQLIDALAFDGLQNSIRYFKKAWEQGDNLEARSGMSYAAMLSGIALANAGLGIVHGFASSVGGYFPIPHGVVCGTLLAECTAMNIEKLSKNKEEAYFKYARVGRLMTTRHDETDDFYCKLLTDTLRKWIDEMGIARLSAFGVKRENIRKIALVTENKNNPVTLSAGEMSYILETRL